MNMAEWRELRDKEMAGFIESSIKNIINATGDTTTDSKVRCDYHPEFIGTSV